MPACHRCGAAFDARGIVPRSAACASCNAWLKSCRNCRHHDAKAKNECRETLAEPVADKDAANFCEHYSPNDRPGTASPTAKKGGGDDAFDALFKK